MSNVNRDEGIMFMLSTEYTRVKSWSALVLTDCEIQRCHDVKMSFVLMHRSSVKTQITVVLSQS